MEDRITIVSIMVEQPDAAEQVNALLHDFAPYIIGRFGLPYAAKQVAVICVVMDAPGTVVSSLSGKLGMVEGVSCKTLTSKY